MHSVTIPWPRLPSDSSILSVVQAANVLKDLATPRPREAPLPTLDLSAANAKVATTGATAEAWPTFTGSLRCASPAMRHMPSEQAATATTAAARSSANGIAAAQVAPGLAHAQHRWLMTAVIATSLAVLIGLLAGAVYLVLQHLITMPPPVVVATSPAAPSASAEPPMAPTPATPDSPHRSNVPIASGTSPKQHANLRRPERAPSSIATAKASIPTPPPLAAATAVAAGIKAPQLPPPSAATGPEGESTPRFTRQRRAATEVNEAAASSPLIVP